LQADGRDDEATIVRTGLVWDDLDQVRPWEAGFALNDATRPGVQLAVSPLLNGCSQPPRPLCGKRRAPRWRTSLRPSTL
jgi:hypothetical protein